MTQWLVLVMLVAGTFSSLQAQEMRDNFRGKEAVRIAFWNMENLFFPADDSLTRDDSFTPYGDNHWSFKKYNEKLQRMGKAITALGGWEAVEMIGFCEVEHKKVLEDLINKSTLSQNKYGIVHQESPDKRGIDVALIYRTDKISMLNVRYITVSFGPNSRPTRDILQVSAQLPNKDTIHVFYNHWPSRYGGELATIPKRAKAAEIVKQACDSIYQLQPNANILIMGDLNDEPIDPSVKEVLNAKPDTNNTSNQDLINLMHAKMGKEGTHKYQGEWGVLDHIIVSKPLFYSTNTTHLFDFQGHIFKPDFLVEDDGTHLGTKPFRTYIGMKHNGGYSDHLPIYVDLRLQSKVQEQ